ncbi:MAG: hypothetical protein ABR878_09320 [Roseiarcus sp.]|jgi:hypothetical protein
MRISAVASLGIFAMTHVILFNGARADAHDLWRNGEPVPEWVKRMCCGSIEAHNLRDSEVKVTPDGYLINGWPDVIPYAKALPSPDGTYWAFYEDVDDGDSMNCFFAPIGTS